MPATTIANVDITDVCFTPIIGRTVGESLDCTLPEDANYTVYEDNWYSSETLTESSVFEEGKNYTRIIVMEANEGYEFSKYTLYTVNGSSEGINASMSGIPSGYPKRFMIQSESFEAEYDPEVTINNITITNADVTPIIGKTAADCLDCELPENAKYTVSKHTWYCDTDDAYISDTSVFEEGKEYSLTWDFTAADGYYFSEDTVVTINGSTDIVDMEYTLISDDSEIFFVWTLPTAAVRDPETVIDTIVITNADVTPIIGVATGECLDYDLPEDASYTVSDHYWYCDTDDEKMSASSLFEEDKDYSLCWELTAADDYIFSEDAGVTINGSTTVLNSATGVDNYDSTIFYVWTLSAEAEAPVLGMIDTVEIINADLTPIIGDMAGDHLICELPAGVNYHLEVLAWGNYTDDSPMMNTDVFIEGKEYVLLWVILADEGYKFASDAAVIINGSEDNVFTELTELNDTECFIASIPKEAVETPAFELGDVNMDGVINTGDAVIILRQNVGIVTFTEEQETLADYNKDGKVNTGDAVAVLRYCVSKEEK